MARFLGLVSGRAKTDATRLGSPNSGIRAQAQGWDCGVTVYGRVNENGRDEFQIYVNGGSNGRYSNKLLATVTDRITGIEVVRPN